MIATTMKPLAEHSMARRRMQKAPGAMDGPPLAWLFVLVALAIAGLACSTSSTREIAVESKTAKGATDVPTRTLPAPFQDVRVGMTSVDLFAKFPPAEDVSACSPKLIGGDVALPLEVPGTEKKPRALCARARDLGGMAHSEEARVAEWIRANRDWASRWRIDFADFEAGLIYSIAQLRGSVRSGAVPESALIDAANGKSATAFGTVYLLASALLRGGEAFAMSTSSRREVCALIADTCDDLDPERVRKYVHGEFSLRQIDADAHSRVVYGKCRTPYLQAEKGLAAKLLRRAGGLGGIGLARASQSARALAAEDISSFKIYSTRSKLDLPVAKLGVILANALPQAESYWSGAVALYPGNDTTSQWGPAVVWLRDGTVIRILLNIANDEALGELPTDLGKAFGVGASEGSVTTWPLSEHLRAQLDIGAASALVVENRDSLP